MEHNRLPHTEQIGYDTDNSSLSWKNNRWKEIGNNEYLKIQRPRHSSKQSLHGKYFEFSFAMVQFNTSSKSTFSNNGKSSSMFPPWKNDSY